MDESRLGNTLKEFADKKILVIGDVMLDRFLWGNVSRISPEAPVPVVEIEREELYPGGAANVARNLQPFAKSVSVMGITGNDREGEQLIEILTQRGLNTECIQNSESNITTVKTRVVARHQQVVRIDHERHSALSDAQEEQAVRQITERLPELDAIIIQDYGKGFITQRLIDRISKAASSSQTVITVDPNPNNPIIWRGVTAIKPNRNEAFNFAKTAEATICNPPSEDNTLRRIAQSLFDLWETKHLLITLGEQGMVLCENESNIIHIPSRAQEVFDVSGAGDTAIAIFTLALASGLEAVEAAEISNWASAVVIGKFGTATLEPEELLSAASDCQ
ncbi:MAG: D-glycero-beta-D-manno-heptose-7-phosphate kinase [Verrucomicrobiaceae bacterium]|nr:D-glycero-beta-D-manno-heptose-7-phosphate kinase [Verrucomicrobiaceae bacterium]